MLRMLRTLMTRRTGQAYPITDDWREAVRRALERRGMSQVDLARAAGCSGSSISELLNGKSKESPLIPDIHSALEWSPPHGARLSDDAEELLAHWEKMDPGRRARLLERAAMLAEDATKDPGKKR